MHLRFTASYYDEEKEKFCSGIFRAADYIRDKSNISNRDKEILSGLIKWFDNNMPIPEFYQTLLKEARVSKGIFGLKIVRINL